VARLGKYWNKIISVSEYINNEITDKHKNLISRSSVIPFGIETPESYINRVYDNNSKINIVYTGRIVQKQKRVADLTKIVNLLVNRNVDFQLTIVGDGKFKTQLEEMMKEYVEMGFVIFTGELKNAEVLNILDDQDIFILTSDYEGLPISLLEAMSRGCIPIVSDLKSGIPQLIVNNENGFRAPVGNIEKYFEYIKYLKDNIELRKKMSFNAYETILNNEYNSKTMVENYIKIFNESIDEVNTGDFRREKKFFTAILFNLSCIGKDILNSGIFNKLN